MKTRNFKSSIEKLVELASKHPQRPHSLRLGEGDSSWTVFFCPHTKHYYAMNMASGECIQSSISSIYKAYQIDTKTGTVINSTLENKPRLFAVKVFTGNKMQNIEMAENETKALRENQFAELTYSAKGQPMIIMDYHPGEALCASNGEPNHDLLKPLTLAQRFTLIFQIANQYNDIQKKSWLHVDVKGSNIVIHIAKNGKVNARVVDFGSSKKLNEGQDWVPTGLMGLTPYTIPPEAVKKNNNAFLPLDENVISGFLNSKSDIYGLGAIFALILGATNPYQDRQKKIISENHFFSMRVIEKQINAGFNFAGLLNKNIKKFSFGIRVGSQACGFRNFSTIEAPNDKTILKLDLPELCYILYKDQLLYVDKTKVLGRKNTKPIPFKKTVANILAIKDTDELNDYDLRLCTNITNYHCFNEKPLDDILKPLLEIFLEQMVAKDHRQRPCMDEVLRFFTIVNRLESIINTEDDRDTIELKINIALLQLNLIVCKAWKIDRVFYFDFNSLEENEGLFNQLCEVLSREKILNGSEPLTEDHFQFLPQYVSEDITQVAESLETYQRKFF